MSSTSRLEGLEKPVNWGAHLALSNKVPLTQPSAPLTTPQSQRPWDHDGLSGKEMSCVFDPASVLLSISTSIHEEKIRNFQPLYDIRKTMGLYLTSLHEACQYLGGPKELPTRFADDTIFVSLACGTLYNKLMKIGIAVLDTENLEGAARTPEHEYMWRIKSHHVERVTRADEQTENEEMRTKVMLVFDKLTQDTKKKIVLVGHKLDAVLDVLGQIKFTPLINRQIRDMIDTQRIFSAYHFEAKWSSEGANTVVEHDLYGHFLDAIAADVDLDSWTDQSRAPDNKAFITLQAVVRIVYFTNRRCSPDSTLAQYFLPRGGTRWLSEWYTLRTRTQST